MAVQRQGRSVRHLAMAHHFISDRGSKVMRFLILVCALCLAWLPRITLAADAGWWHDDWSFRKEIPLDTSAKGANLSQGAGRVPLLIRLHSGNFQFDGVAQNGNDLRFIGSDGKTPLHYQLEQFATVLGGGQIWGGVAAPPAHRGGH